MNSKKVSISQKIIYIKEKEIRKEKKKKDRKKREEKGGRKKSKKTANGKSERQTRNEKLFLKKEKEGRRKS